MSTDQDSQGVRLDIMTAQMSAGDGDGKDIFECT